MKATGIVLDTKNKVWRINLQDNRKIEIAYTETTDVMNTITISAEAMQDITELLGGTVV